MMAVRLREHGNGHPQRFRSLIWIYALAQHMSGPRVTQYMGVYVVKLSRHACLVPSLGYTIHTLAAILHNVFRIWGHATPATKVAHQTTPQPNWRRALFSLDCSWA